MSVSDKNQTGGTSSEWVSGNVLLGVAVVVVLGVVGQRADAAWRRDVVQGRTQLSPWFGVLAL